MNEPLPKGIFIVVDGIDGAGKTTLVEGLQTYFSEKHIPVVVSKEPTQGPYGAELRKRASLGRLTLEEELEMFTKDRDQHVREIIAPSLAGGKMVILDRYFPSTAAYQGAEGADPMGIFQHQSSLFPTPDVTIILDLPVSVGRDRIVSRGDLPNHFEEEETLERARQIFLTLPFSNKSVLDAECSIEEVHQAALHSIWNAISRRFLSEDSDIAWLMTNRLLGSHAESANP